MSWLESHSIYVDFADRLLSLGNMHLGFLPEFSWLGISLVLSTK